MKLHLLENCMAGGYAQFGSIWKKGEVRDCRFRLINERNKEVFVQSRISAYWPDGSVKWAAHTADSSAVGECAEIIPDKGSAPEICAKCTETKEGWRFCSPTLSLEIPKSGNVIFRDLKVNGRLRMKHAYLKLLLERHFHAAGLDTQIQYSGRGVLKSAVMEESGPLMWSFRLEGIHELAEIGEQKIPFILRLKLYHDTDRIDIQHTFLFDGDERIDFLKGIGIAATCPLSGETFDRHIRFGTDYGSFHEAASLMLVWDHKRPGPIYERQIRGLPLEQPCMQPCIHPCMQPYVQPYIPSAEEFERLKDTAQNCPVWDHYELAQDSDMHFGIRKRTAGTDRCFLDALHGKRAPGVMAFGGSNGSILMGLKDFWQKYPSGLELQGLAADAAEAVIWIYSPSARAYDYRHYDHRAYAETCYEGFPEVGATPYGVANTNDCSIAFRDEIIPSEEDLDCFARSVNDPPVYFGEPAYYHDLRAFGYWSLPSRRTQALAWIEDELDRAVDFYLKEVEARHWYGMYDYGDVMHTYDRFRHIWRYDIGGYAWQNTELMPTMWLWLAFLRSGRGEILKLAEAMTRHASDVDVYHLGKLKGLGTRHGVRHWGCSCKEIRIGMAGHYRFHYYLLCDRRFEDVFEDTKDADYSLLSMDPLRYVYGSGQSQLPTHARSGPDWAAMVSNWMTQWERGQDEQYLQKILTGMEDIKAAPLGLMSGPDFEYDPATGHLRYIGENATGGIHLQISLGGPQVWMELADLLGDEKWAELIAQYGRFYYLSPEEKQQESRGLIGERVFLYPVMAAAMAAYGAAKLGDHGLAQRTVQYLFRALLPDDCDTGFAVNTLADCGNQPVLSEIPWITTNFTSQWCLNAIMVLEFIRDAIPETLEEVRGLLEGFPKEELFRTC